VPGLADTDEPIRWSQDGRSIFVVAHDTASVWHIYRVDVASGRRDLVRELRTAGPVGAGGLVNALISADGRSIVYTTNRYYSDLFLIEGLR
jgi:Tol biopolymer transport system component